jgi:hypothetical protein
MNIFLTIAGIIFGGGMIGQLIMFFVKRNDEKNNSNNDDLKAILVKLSDYGKLINDELLSSITYIKSDTAKKRIEVHALRDLVSITSKDTSQLKKKLKNSAEMSRVEIEQSRELSKSLEKTAIATSEKLNELESYFNSGSEPKIKELYNKLQAYNSLSNVLPQTHVIKHKEVIKILYDLDVQTADMLMKTEFISPDDLLELNKLLINQLSLLTKAKVIVSNKIKS